MAFGAEPRSKFDALNFAGPLRRLLGIKGNQDIPQELNTDLLQPTVDINHRGFADYKTFLVRETTFPTATTDKDSKDLIGWSTIASSPLFDSTDFEVLILGHHSACVFAVAPVAGEKIGADFEIRGKTDLPTGQSPSTPCTLWEMDRMYDGDGQESIFIAGLFGNKSRRPSCYDSTNIWAQASFGNRFWLPNKMTFRREWTLANHTFAAGDLIVDEVFGVVCPKHTAPPLF